MTDSSHGNICSKRDVWQEWNNSQHDISDSITQKGALCQFLMEVIQIAKILKQWAALASSQNCVAKKNLVVDNSFKLLY